ncbi:MarR family winged helix-turn-helix transcriptional regulator [Nocardia africana]|uniref:MarR family winged helix-turn-helix transcriptional regulator n=1 Tax=Nocardia africana TaxID=134964 RepID=A0ABW6NRN4_9NOCA
MDDVTNTREAIAEELQSVVGALVRRMRSASPARRISLSQLSILKRLDREGPATVADLARADKVRHQTVAVAVSALEGRGLLMRTPDPDDQRRKRLHITDAGLDLLSERREAGYGHLAELIATRLTPAEQRQLAATLPILSKLLE